MNASLDSKSFFFESAHSWWPDFTCKRLILKIHIHVSSSSNHLLLCTLLLWRWNSIIGGGSRRRNIYTYIHPLISSVWEKNLVRSNIAFDIARWKEGCSHCYYHYYCYHHPLFITILIHIHRQNSWEMEPPPSLRPFLPTKPLLHISQPFSRSTII